jgi:hypothetical protein
VALFLLWLGLPRRGWGAFALWSLFGGVCIGPLALNVVNRIGVHEPAHEVELKIVARPKGNAELIVVDDAFKGIKFLLPIGGWKPDRHGCMPAKLRRGRLGVWWGELR